MLPLLDAAIAYYLVGIMLVLGIIIVTGVIRQKMSKDKE